MENKIISIKERLSNIQQHFLHLLEQKTKNLQKFELAFSTIDDIHADMEYSKVDQQLLEPEVSMLLSTIQQVEEYLQELELDYKNQLASIAKHRKAVKVINNLTND